MLTWAYYMECTKYISCLFIYIQQQVQTSNDNVAAAASTATSGDHVARETPQVRNCMNCIPFQYIFIIHFWNMSCDKTTDTLYVSNHWGNTWPLFQPFQDNGDDDFELPSIVHRHHRRSRILTASTRVCLTIHRGSITCYAFYVSFPSTQCLS